MSEIAIDHNPRDFSPREDPAIVRAEPERIDLKANILLVDDRADKLLALESILSDLGQNIVKAHSGKEALRCLLKQDFAVILLDVSMPGMDGFETAALIRQRLASERTPIIFVTSYGMSEGYMSRGYSLGAVDYLLTPIVPEVLCTKVSVLVDLYRQTELIRHQSEQLRKLEQSRHERELAAVAGELEKETASQREIRRLNTELETKVAALTSANQELEAFNYSIAHDLRAPLRAMGSFADALLEDEAGGLTAKGTEYARRIVRSAKYMDTLLQDLLAYSGLARAEMPLECLNLEELVGETLTVFGDEIQQRGTQVEMRSPLGNVLGHAPTLRQILNNLVDNALKFTGSGRTPLVRFHSEEKNSRLRLWVQDNGIGIPPEQKERVFGLFRRLHNSDEYPGTGVGLAIVRRGAERMGGHAGVESTPGEGSRFWIELAAASGGSQ